MQFFCFSICLENRAAAGGPVVGTDSGFLGAGGQHHWSGQTVDAQSRDVDLVTAVSRELKQIQIIVLDQTWNNTWFIERVYFD